MSSTVTQGKSKKSYSPEVQISQAQRVQKINKELLSGGYFPGLANLPDINYITMAIWWLESSGRLLYNGQSRQSAPIYTGAIAKDYSSSVNYQNFIKQPGLTPTQKVNAEDGFCFHGLTAAGGAYFIKDTKLNKGLSAYKPLMNRLAGEGSPVEVDLGTSMTTLFSSNTDAAIKASLAQGLIILNWKFLNALQAVFPTDQYKALIYSIGAYLGFGIDKNGVTGTSRIAQIATGNNPNLKVLARAGIVAQNQDLIYATGQSVVTAKITKLNVSPTTTSSTSPARVATTNVPASTSNPEC